MFGLGDDFEIDENFLDEVFEVEKACITNASKKVKSAGRTTSLEETRLNILEDQPVTSGSLSPFSTDTPQITTTSLSHSTSVSKHEIGTRSRSHKVSLLSESTSRKVRTRKFPGPAGLLPERQGNSSLVATEDFLNELEEELKDESKYKEEQVLSQDSARSLESPAWAELINDLGCDGKALLKNLNIASVCGRAKQSRALKVPFLALLIHNVDASTADPCLYLSDSTGEIVGAVHREVWEQLGQDLVAGTVIVLINVGILCAGQTTSRHYLNITANNIAALYSPTSGSDISVTNMKPLSQPDCSKFLQVWRDIQATPIQVISQATSDTRQLFTTASLSPSPSLSHSRHLSNTGNAQNKSFNIPFSNHTPTLESPISFRGGTNDRFSNSSPVSSHCSNYLSRKSLNSKSTSHKPNSKVNVYNGLNRNCIPNHSNSPANISPFVHKRPRFETPPAPTTSIIFPSLNATQDSTTNQSIIESELDGIDTDSLFGDF